MATLNIKLREVLDAVPVLTKLTEHKFPASVAFDLSRLIKALQVELNAYDETRIALIKQYGETVPVMAKIEGTDDETPTGEHRTQVKAEFMNEFHHELSDLLNKQIEIVAPMIPLKALDVVGDISIQEMNVLQVFINPEGA